MGTITGEMVSNGEHPKCHVFVDGNMVNDCIAVNVEEGWAEYHARHPSGCFIVIGDHFETRRVHGKVEVVPH